MLEEQAGRSEGEGEGGGDERVHVMCRWEAQFAAWARPDRARTTLEHPRLDEHGLT